jgi:hypothetical protein
MGVHDLNDLVGPGDPAGKPQFMDYDAIQAIEDKPKNDDEFLDSVVIADLESKPKNNSLGNNKKGCGCSGCAFSCFFGCFAFVFVGIILFCVLGLIYTYSFDNINQETVTGTVIAVRADTRGSSDSVDTYYVITIKKDNGDTESYWLIATPANRSISDDYANLTEDSRVRITAGGITITEFDVHQIIISSKKLD